MIMQSLRVKVRIVWSEVDYSRGVQLTVYGVNYFVVATV